VDQHQVEKWVEFMREHGLKRLAISGLEVELGAPPSSHSAKEAPVATQGVFEGGAESFCGCGHQWIDHSDAGCLMGCSHGLCVKQEALGE